MPQNNTTARILQGFTLCKHTDNLQKGMWFLCEDTQYLHQALALGAAGIITTREIAQNLTCPYIITPSPWQTWSDFCALTYPKSPKFVIGVTGTSGKTSTAYTTFLLWRNLGLKTAYIGTSGVYSNVETSFNSTASLRTTPDAFELHQMLNCFAENGITHVAMEISSSGLQRKRVGNVRLDVAVWTSFGREHLDIHGDMKEYWNTKLEITKLIKPGGSFIIAKELAERILITGVDFEIYNEKYIYENPSYDFFMRDNLQAAGRICELSGFSREEVAVAVSKIASGVPGRLEMVAPDIIVDFAHNPSALERLLLSFPDRDIVLVFGCGGDRDKGKRVIMGEIAARLAKIVIVTDDNPRTEGPAQIRAEVVAGCPDALEIGDRAQAIREGIGRAREIGALCIIAGKGSESGQIYGDETLPFSDVEAVRICTLCKS